MACPKCVGIQGDLWHVPSVRDYRVIYVECVLSVKVYRVIHASCVLEFTGWVMSHVSDSLYKVISHILLSVLVVVSYSVDHCCLRFERRVVHIVVVSYSVDDYFFITFYF
jgi:hypothetical protein